MMKFLKRSIGMALLLVILLTGCTGDKSEASISKEDEKTIENFLNSYLEQFNYSEKEWEDLIEQIESKISDYDPQGSQWEETLNDDPWLAQWTEVLTQKEIERLIKNGWLPNLSLREYPGTKYTIENLEKTDDPDSYIVKVELKNIENGDIDEKIDIPIDMADTEEERRIGYIDFEKFNSLFTVKK